MNKTPPKSGKLAETKERSAFKVLLTYPNYSMMLTPSYAVGLFTAILKKQGYTVNFFDCTPYEALYEESKEPTAVVQANKLMTARRFDPQSLFGSPKKDLLGDFARMLDGYKPHAVVFSTVCEDTWQQTHDMLEVLSHYPQIQSIVGGVYPTMAPNNVMADPYVRCIGRGEGEETIVDFCEAVRHGEPAIAIPGTTAKDENNRIIHNRPRPLVNIDNIPIPDFSLFDDRRFYRPLGAKIWKTIPIETYRGCPYTCTFCNSPAQVTIAKDNNQGIYTRRKSIDRVRAELTDMTEKLDAEFIFINDDAFMARPRQETKAFMDMYKKDINLPFWFQTRFEDVDEEKLAWAKDAGCYRISFGLEHGNEEFRREILFRRISNEAMVEKAHSVSQVGIPYSVNVIIGLPYETRALVFDTIHLNRNLGGFDSVAPNIFTPYHGTVLREMAIREGWLSPDARTKSYFGGSILTMPAPYLQSDEMLALQKTYNLYVNLPESRWPDIARAEQPGQEGQLLLNELSKEFYKLKYGQDENQRMMTYAG